jgi:CubicO group peptidase (beta-lactamase class C family)
MVSAFAGRAAAATLAISVFFVGFTFIASAQDENGAGVGGARTENLQALTNLPAILVEHYPTVRAIVLARGDCAVLEYYGKGMTAETRSPVYSVTKSVLSILVGIAIDEGYLRLDEKLSELFPDAFDEYADPRARDIRVRDILTKTEGFAEDGEAHLKFLPPGSPLWKWTLNRPVKYLPGTHFRYDHVGSDLLAVVLSQAIKWNALNFAQEKLLKPLQIENYAWAVDVEEHLHGEVGLALTARDMAKIGMLYLRNGRWGGRQIVSQAYVLDSTARHNDGGPPVRAAGYGYQWWIGKTAANLEAFFASGVHGQLIYVAPGLDLVVAVSANSIPGGSQKFVNDVIIPAAAGLAGSSCVTRLAPE